MPAGRSAINIPAFRGLKNLATFSKGCRKFFLKHAFPYQPFIARFHSLGQWGTNLGKGGRWRRVPYNVFLWTKIAISLASVKRLHIRFYTSKIGMSKVSVRLVPKQLTEDQKASRLSITKEHLRRFNHDESKDLTLSTLGKIFSRRHFEIFFLFFPENRIWHFMQIVSLGDNLHEMSNPVFWEK